MAWFVWIRGLRGPSPRLVFESHGKGPYLDESLKGHVLAQHQVRDDEIASIADLTKRFPAPAERDDG